jgi:hypothetical protein
MALILLMSPGPRVLAAIHYRAALARSAGRVCPQELHAGDSKQVHDANIVATMRSKGITRLATLNAGDFERYEDDISIESLVT